MCPYDLGVPGGVQTQVKGLSAELGRAGHEVTLLAPATPSAPGGPETPPRPGESPARPGSVRVERVGRAVAVPVNGSRAPICLDPRSIAAVARGLRRPLDVVHVHEPMVPLVGVSAVLLARAPVVATFHRSGSDPLYRIEGRLLRRLAGRLAGLAAVSPAAMETARTVLGLAEMPVVPNGVPLAGPAPERGRSKGAAPRIVFVGRHEARKGLAVLLDAFELLPPGAELDIVGEGPETPALRERSAGNERIHWYGRLDDASKAPLLSTADLYVAPSLRGESFGVVLLEAMASGTPVVASDLPGYRQAAGDAALFVPPGDAGLLAAGITALLSDPARRAQLGLAGRERAEAFSIGETARRYVALYEDVAGGRHDEVL